MEACYFLDLEIIVWDCGMLLGQQALVKEKSQEIWYEVLTEYFNLSSPQYKLLILWGGVMSKGHVVFIETRPPPTT